MALLDEGETDWKIIVIDVNDPLAPKLNDIEDVERHLPGLIRATNEWFRVRERNDGPALTSRRSTKSRVRRSLVRTAADAVRWQAREHLCLLR